MFNGFIHPRLTKVESLTLPGYIPEFIFLQVASLKMLLKPLPTASVEVQLNKSLIEAVKKFQELI